MVNARIERAQHHVPMNDLPDDDRLPDPGNAELHARHVETCRLNVVEPRSPERVCGLVEEWNQAVRSGESGFALSIDERGSPGLGDRAPSAF